MIKCRVCHNNNLEEIVSLGDLYLSSFSGDKPPRYPLTLMRCDNCSLVQLADTTPPELLYTDDYGYYSGINQTMRDHLAEITHSAERIVDLQLGDTVIDIGCNDGTLLKSYESENISKVGFDPVQKFEDHADFMFVGEFFNHHQDIPKAKIITAISMFYDLDDPNAFLEDIVKSLSPDGIFIIQQNYLKGMLEQMAFDNIVHEHLEYYTLFSLNNLLRRHNLEVFDVEQNDLNGGSFRTYIKFVDNKNIRVYDRVAEFGADEINYFVSHPNVYEDFKKGVEKVKEDVYTFVLEESLKGKSIYVYGASTRGNTLLQACHLNNKLISYAVERNPNKWGKYIMSLDIPIISEDQARANKPDYMLVLPWFFKEEIVAREKEYLKHGHLIFALPSMEVI